MWKKMRKRIERCFSFTSLFFFFFFPFVQRYLQHYRENDGLSDSLSPLSFTLYTEPETKSRFLRCGGNVLLLNGGSRQRMEIMDETQRLCLVCEKI